MLNSRQGATDILNVQEYHPTIYLGPRLEDEKNDEVPPFYVSLSIHDMKLHNSMLDLGSSHNLMPKVIMEMMGLEITGPYKDLFPLIQKEFSALV